MVYVYTNTLCMGRQPKPDHLRRSKMLPIRLTDSELRMLEGGAERLGITVAQLLRDGAALYMKLKSKDGHRKGKEKKER